MAARRRFRLGLVVVGVVAIALVAWVALRKPKAEAKHTPVTSVAVARAAAQDLPVSITALGAAQAWTSVTIHAQVSGRLISVPFKEGATVKAGQLLAQIDPAPFNAALKQAQGALLRDKAQLENARLDLARDKILASQDSISKQAADTQQALVHQDEGVVLADQGAVDAAAVNVRFARITSPITGRVGVRLVDVGNIVGPGDATGLLTVNQIEPIAVTFTVPEGDFERLSIVSDGFRRPLSTAAFSQESGAPMGTGSLSIADNHVDPTSGTVTLKARFENRDHRLWPGQFVNVRLTLQTLHGAVTIPVGAVNKGPKGTFAYVVGANGKVAMQPITVDTTQGDIAVIRSGLKGGETVVTDGQLTLKPGATVRVAGQRPGPAAGASPPPAHGQGPAA